MFKLSPPVMTGRFEQHNFMRRHPGRQHVGLLAGCPGHFCTLGLTRAWRHCRWNEPARFSQVCISCRFFTVDVALAGTGGQACAFWHGWSAVLSQHVFPFRKFRLCANTLRWTNTACAGRGAQSLTSQNCVTKPTASLC